MKARFTAILLGLTIIISILIGISNIRITSYRVGFVRPDPSFELFSVNPDGTNLIKLTDDNIKSGFYSWTADGNMIACAQGKTIYYMTLEEKVFHSIDCQGISSIDELRISPDKTMIAYISGDMDIYIYEFENQKSIKIVDLPAQANDIAWSPDSRRLLFDSLDSKENFILYVINTDGTKLNQITNEYTGIYEWSNDCTTIAVDVGRDETQRIDIIKLDKENAIDVKTSIPGGYSPKWSPNDYEFVYTNKINNIETIYIVKSDGSKNRPLSNGSTQSVAWRNDGKAISFPFKDAIYMLNIETNSKVNLTGNKPYPACCLKYSPDDAKILFTSSQVYGKLFVMSADGTLVNEITPHDFNWVCCTFWQSVATPVIYIIEGKNEAN